MIEKNTKDLEEIENKLIDAKENHGLITPTLLLTWSLTHSFTYLGDMEVLDIMFKKARHLSQVGDWDTANSAFDEIIKKDKVSTGHSLAYYFSYLLTHSLTYSGKKIEAKLEQIRIFLFNNDIPKIKENIAAAKVLIDKGGDWDKRNRLKVFTHSLASYSLTYSLTRIEGIRRIVFLDDSWYKERVSCLVRLYRDLFLSRIVYLHQIYVLCINSEYNDS